MNYESEKYVIGINCTPFEELSWSVQPATWPIYEKGICKYNYTITVGSVSFRAGSMPVLKLIKTQ